MSETKFTPGPWGISPEKYAGDFLVTAPDAQDHLDQPWSIASVHAFVNDPDEAPANAALIANATALYAALEDAEAFIAKTSGGGATDFRAKLNAVLAKARGDLPTHPSNNTKAA